MVFCRMKFSKKGVVVQLHWIFILIAGGIILAFFLSVANKQSDLSENKLSLSLVQSLGVAFEMAEAGESSSQKIVLPSKGVSFSCSDFCDCFIGSGKASRSFSKNIIFAEEKIDSPDAIVWSLPWKVPFKVANLLFFLNPENHFIVVYKNNCNFCERIKNKIKNIIPDNVFFEFLSVDEFNSVSFDGSKLTKVLFISDSAPFLPVSLKGEDVKFVNIEEDKIIFYDIDRFGSFEMVNAVALPEDIVWILASFFSSDYNMFVCGVKSAFNRLNFVANIFLRRAQILSEAVEDSFFCLYPEDVIAKIITENVDYLEDDELWSAIRNVNIQKGVLEERNDRLIRQSCPELF
jgi:hypothetical protein